ncbi:WD40 repeat-like protein [Serendipita vermifera]|nr:WD40 repeat-like protein [Serendipita vermifera]
MEDVEQFARISQLRKAMEDTRPLIEETTNFILRYTSRSGTTTAKDSIFSSSDHAHIQNLKSRFEQFKQQFDRGVSVQSALNLEMLLTEIGTRLLSVLVEVSNEPYTASDRDDALLAELKPKDIERASPHSGCMKGTREDIFSTIDGWLTDFDGPNILWLKGHPGSGKSAIASSLVERLFHLKPLGANFFFQRDNAATTTSNALWRMVAFELSRQYPGVRKILVAKLRADEIYPATTNIESLFKHCIFDALVASEDIPIGRLPVIVIDALDECGGLEGSLSVQRRALMKTLESWSKLPRKFKLLVTSRGEIDIEQTFQATSHVSITLSTGHDVSIHSLNDIREYLKHEFRIIASRYSVSLNAEWPGELTIDALTKKASGLFIWAKTVIRFINMGPPKNQLKLLSEGSGLYGMANLYSRLLEITFPEQTVQYASATRSIFATIILAKRPLSASSITKLLNVEGDLVEDVCIRMRSVLDTQSLLRISHQSFVDFLLDEKICPPTFYIQPDRWEQALTMACLQMMEKELRFNICGLESSYVRNSDIPGLASRVDASLSPELLYSCHFWAEHLFESKKNDEIYSMIEGFMNNRFLYWLEVLSLRRQVNQASSVLRLLNDWIRENEMDNSLARDMQSFVNAFASVISESVPHIYLSALAFTPRGSTISKRYLGYYPRLLKVETGGQKNWPKMQNLLSGHSGWILSMGISPDGKCIASGSTDMSIRVWDAETGEMIGRPFTGHTGPVTSVAFFPNGKYMVSGSKDSTIRVWNMETGQMTGEPFEGHTGSVTSLSVSPNGNYIFSASDDMTVRVWSTESETGTQIGRPFEGHTGSITSVAFSTDGKYIISGSDDTTIRVWDWEAGEMIRGPLKGHRGAIMSMAVFHNGRYIVSGSTDKTVRIWDMETGRHVGLPFIGHTNWVRSVLLSPDSSRIFSGSDDGTIRMWCTAMYEAVEELFEGHTSRIKSLRFSPDGKHIVSGSSDCTIRIWDSDTGKPIGRPFKGHTDEINCVSFSPNGKYVVSGSDDKTIRVWEVKTGELIRPPIEGHITWITFAGFHPNGKYIISGSYDSTIRVWDVDTGKCQVADTHSPVNFASLSPDDHGDWESFSVWDVETQKMIGSRFTGHTDMISSVAFSPDGKHVISGSQDRSIRVWDVDTGKMIGSPFRGHTDTVNSITVSPDGKRIASGSYDKIIRVWEYARVDNDKPTPTFSSTSEMINGWILGPNSELIFWVPPELRDGLWRPNTVAVMGKAVVTKLDLTNFVHGESWTLCHRFRVRICFPPNNWCAIREVPLEPSRLSRKAVGQPFCVLDSRPPTLLKKDYGGRLAFGINGRNVINQLFTEPKARLRHYHFTSPIKVGLCGHYQQNRIWNVLISLNAEPA